MAEDWRSGGSTKPKKKKAGSPIPTAPTGPRGSAAAGNRSGQIGADIGQPSGGRQSQPGGRSGGSSSSSASASASAAEKRAIARENEAKRKAGQRYISQATNLEAQAAALRHALKIDYRRNLRQQLGDIGEILADQQAIIREGYAARSGQLANAAADNEKALDSQSADNRANMVRERTLAANEVLAQGAGESDLLQSMMMGLRNWQANQGELKRAYFDTLQSVNSGLTDLNVDTKTAFANNEIQANADREQLWTNYFNQRSDSLTQLGNIRGQQADYYDMAKEMGVGKGGGGAKKKAKTAFLGAALESGKSWDNPGVSKKTMQWEGRGSFKGDTSESRLREVPTTGEMKRPEGATLRKW